MKRVVVTGIGAVTPLGNDFNASWLSIKSGFSGIGGITRFELDGLPWKIAGEVKLFEPSFYLTKKEIRTTDLFVQYAVAAALMAVMDADLTGDLGGVVSDFDAPGVIIGSSRGGIESIEREFKRLFARKSNGGPPRLSPFLMPSSTIGMAASYVAQKLNIKGKCSGVSSACASGAVAIGEAFRIIKHGYSSLMIAGGSEAPLCRLCVAGYGSAGALSVRSDSYAVKPFGKGRDGFVLAEGSTVLVLEEYQSALRRGARIYGEIAGFSNTTDAFHITKPSLEGQVMAISCALNEADISPDDLDYVSAHSTSTPLGDKVEASAIKTVFKNNPDIAVSAIKSMTGHMLASSGAFEAACALMSLREGVIPPTINLYDKDPDCDINVIAKMQKAPLNTVISNSFGFGGMNAVLVMKKV
jgi:beta-ketoacyl-acyl-carrier-protein synthase II